MAKVGNAKKINQMTIAQWEKAFRDENACCAYLVRHRWPNGVCCPRCGNPNVKAHGTMPFNWLCNACSPSDTNYRISHITGTLFENTNKPLRDWFRVLHMVLTSKKGVAALEIQRVMGFGSYKTAWYMCMRLRTAMRGKDFQQLAGIVEIDETFIGGKKHNRRKDKRGGSKGGAGPDKTPVIGALSPSKKTDVARVIERVDTIRVNSFVREMVADKVSVLITDQWSGCKTLDVATHA